MDNKSLVRISLACSVVGITLIYGLSHLIEPKSISINLLERNTGRIVQVAGTIVDLRRHEAGHIFVKLKDESGTCEVPLFKDLASKIPELFLGDMLQVIGVVEEYRDAHQVVPRTERDVGVFELPPTPVGIAKTRVGELLKLQGIVYGVSDTERGQEFHLTDGNASIKVTYNTRNTARSGYNMTISGTIKFDKAGNYLMAREMLGISPNGTSLIEIHDLMDMTGVFSMRGYVYADEKGAVIDDGTGTIKIDGSWLDEGIIEGDLVEAIVQRKGDEMKVLEVELDKATILPLERLSGEMVGKTVRIKGTVISKFVSGKNTFLTLHNGTDVEVPLFGTGEDFNVQLGDELTVSGRVGLYRDKLQVVPKELTETVVEAGRIVEKELDELSMGDLYQLVRTRGRITSVRRYARSCSLWIKGNTQKVRVYLTFQPRSNISVGTEIEVVGLVKTYNDEMELVPRGIEDLG